MEHDQVPKFKGGFKELLKDLLPKELLEKVPRSYDIVGDIAIIQLPKEIPSNYAKLVGNAIMRVAKNVKAVYVRGTVTGDLRLRDLKLIAGEEKEETIYVEYGIKFFVNIKKVFINPSLSTEHRRIAELVKDGEFVLDMFAGIGGFSLHIIKLRKAKVIAIDINPYAILCLIKSLELNKKVLGTVIPINGDAKEVLAVLQSNIFDRVIMNLPTAALKFLEDALRVTKNNGVIHLYTISTSAEKVKDLVIDKLQKLELNAEVVNVRKVLDYAPHQFIFRVDIVKY